jgi:predicted nucleic acid-binding protein
MIVADSSSLIAFWAGESGPDVEIVDRSLEERTLVMVPPVIAEILSDPELPEAFREKILSLPALPILEGYWERVGELRASIFSKGRKAKLADSLISQVCLDHEAILIERDGDYRVFSELAGLKLAIPRSS